MGIKIQQFLSTPSARRATRSSNAQTSTTRISIHALREEGDQGNTAALSVTTIFLSTPSARRATPADSCCPSMRSISIHALCEEGDAQRGWSRATPRYFYPRPPRGGRRITRQHLIQINRFLSTPSARRATCSSNADGCRNLHFYPRPPRGGRPRSSPSPC